MERFTTLRPSKQLDRSLCCGSPIPLEERHKRMKLHPEHARRRFDVRPLTIPLTAVVFLLSSCTSTYVSPRSVPGEATSKLALTSSSRWGAKKICKAERPAIDPRNDFLCESTSYLPLTASSELSLEIVAIDGTTVDDDIAILSAGEHVLDVGWRASDGTARLHVNLRENGSYGIRAIAIPLDLSTGISAQACETPERYGVPGGRMLKNFDVAGCGPVENFIPGPYDPSLGGVTTAAATVLVYLEHLDAR